MAFVKQQFVKSSSGSVSFDAVGSAGFYFDATTNSSTTVTGSHTAAGGANNVVLLFVDAQANGPTTAPTITATYNGVSMTSITALKYYDDGSGTLGNVAVFYMFNPPTGAQAVMTIVSSISAADYFITANTVSYNNVNTLGSFVTNLSVDGSTSPTLTVLNTTGSMVSMMFGDTSGGGGFGTFSAYNKTLRFNNTADSVGSYMLIGDTATTNPTFTASQSWGLPWGAIGVPLNP